MRLIKRISNRLKSIAAHKELRNRFQNLAQASFNSEVDKPLKIGFFSTPGTFGSCVDLLFALSLKKFGHDITVVYADESFPLQEIHRKEQPEKWAAKTRKNIVKFTQLAKSAGVSVTPASSIKGSLDASNELSGVDSIVNMSLLRHYRVGEINENLDQVEHRRDLMTQSVKQSVLVGQYFSSEVSVDRLLINHGLYATTGPARLVANAKSVPVLTYDRSKRQGCMNFTWQHSSDKWNIDDSWASEHDKPMSKPEDEELDAYLASRLTHSEDVYQYNSGEKQSRVQLREQLGIPDGKRIYVLFTNVLWDAASSERDLIFSSPVEWVAKTIEIARENSSDFHLIVRIHPAELVIGTEQSFASVIRKLCPEMPENVTVLEPDSEINSWALYDLCDLGLVHTTTAGLELALQGKPVVVASDTHYRGKGFTIDPDSYENYEKALVDVSDQNITASQRQLARKYAHLSLVRYQYRFPWITMGKEKRTVITANNLEDIVKDEQFLHLHNCILSQQPILNPPH